MTASRFESITGELDLDFPEYQRPPADPLELLRDWFAGAAVRGVREPLALALATADERGRPSSRIVSVIRVTDAGVVFATHRTSRKGREMAATGWAAGLLYWRETGQQVAFSGPVAELEPAESDALWHARPVPLHAMSTVSRQSEPLAEPETLRAEARRLEASGRPLPRPDRYAGYLLRPAEVEFWSAGSDRLHRRLRYDAAPGGPGWTVRRLQP